MRSLAAVCSISAARPVVPGTVLGTSWILFTALMYLILTEAVRPWIHLPYLGNVGFTVVFVLFALVHCAAIEGPWRTGIFFVLAAVVSYVMEEIGVQTGVIYGAYHYSDLLGVKIGHVPMLIPLAWFMMIYPSWSVANAAVTGIDVKSFAGITALAAVAAVVMTGWDAVMDPGMAAAGNWVWENGGVYFGVPRHNYVGWLLTTFPVYWIFAALGRRRAQLRSASPIFRALPVIVYAFFAVRYMAANQIAALQLVALFSMGTPALIALIQLSGSRARSA